MYKEIVGDLVTLGKEFAFDVIAHGVNCMCTQKKGLAVRMAEVFKTDKFHLERSVFIGDINKLGQIDHQYLENAGKQICIVNCYIQYQPASAINPRPINYHALKLCLQKINFKFKGKHIGLPGYIGGGLAGGSISIIRTIIKSTLTDCDVTIVKLKEDG